MWAERLMRVALVSGGTVEIDQHEPTQDESLEREG